MDTQAFYMLMDRNRIAMIEDGEVTKPPHDNTPRRGRNGRALHVAEKVMAREIWAEIRHRMTRAEACREIASIVRQKTGADPAAVAFDGIQAAQSRGRDVVIVDTAGRLHTQTNLMEELAKVRRVIAGRLEGAPHETLLVLDASQGQNALAQALKFHERLGVTGLAITKLDGTAKGGILVALADRFGLPIHFIGVGEGADDLQVFAAASFARALTGAP